MVTPKTLAMKRLDARGVPYETRSYPPSVRDAVEVAAAIDEPPSSVYKTLVVQRNPGRPLLVLLAGDRQLDLKRLAGALGEKTVQLAAHRDAERLTGLRVGGISALAVRDGAFDVCIDAAALGRARIFVSAGQRGVQLGVGVDELIALTGARLVALTESSAPAASD